MRPLRPLAAGPQRRAVAVERVGALLIGVALAGCASAPGGDPERDAALKTFSVPPDRGGLYVFRSDAAAPAVPVDVDVDDVPLGRLGARTYLYREVAPGRHTVAAHAGNTATIEVEVDAGSTSFVRQEMTWGFWQAGTRLRLASEAEGRQGVRDSGLAASVVPTQQIEVRVDSQDPAWQGPLACEASNPLGRWPFDAPGTVTVDVARAPLRIACRAPAGMTASTAVEATASAPTAAQQQRNAAAAGAAVGAGLGLAAGVAAAPVAGPALVVLLALGGAWRGAEVGHLAAGSLERAAAGYPDPIVLSIPKPAPAK